MKKRILSGLLTIALLLTLVTPVTLAAGETLTFSTTANLAGVKAGDSFDVTIESQEITGAYSGDLKISFDKSVFKVTNIVWNSTIRGNAPSSVSEANSNGYLQKGYVDNIDYESLNIPADTLFVTATFEVLDTAVSGVSNITLAYEFTDEYSSSMSGITANTNTLAVTVVSKLTGDQTITMTTKPAAGAATSTVAATGTNFTVSFADWKQGETSVTTFEAGKPYTATGKLTANTGYQFASGAKAVISGTGSGAAVDDSSNVSADGKTLTFTYSYTTPELATPDTVTAPTAGAITYGDALSTSALTGGSVKNGGTDITGGWAWADGTAKPAVSDSGTTTYDVVFTPTGADAAVYGPVTKSITLTVNPKALDDVAIAAIADRPYTGSAIQPVPAVTSSQTIGGYTLVKDTDYTVSYGANTSVGTGSVTVTAKAGSNYTFTPARTANFNITKATGSIVIAEPGTIIYDGSAVTAGTSSADLIYTKNTDATETVTWYEANEVSEGNYTKGSAVSAPTNAGIYYIGVSATATTNYNAIDEVTHLFTITPKDISGVVITFGTQAEYDGNSHDVVITSVKDGSLSLTKGTDYTLGAGSSATNVESKTLTINGIGNYQGSAVSAAWSLVPKEVTLTWENFSSRTYGDGKTVTATVSNKVGTDEVNVTVSGGDATAVGTGYTATATGLTGAQSGNYKLPTTDPTQAYTIGKAAAPTGVKADFEVLYNDTAEKPVTLSNFNLPSDIVNPSFKGTAGTNTGADVVASGYTNDKFALKSGLTEANNGNTASWTVTIQSDNYGDITAAVNVKVIKKLLNTTTLAVSQDNFTYSVGAADPVVSNKPAAAGTVTFSYSGRSGTTYGPSDTAPTAAGDYTVTARCEDSECIYTATADFTINKKSINGMTVTLSDTSKVYSGADQTVTVTSVGTLTASDYDVTTGTTGKNVGTYTVTVTGKGNYEGTASADWDITPKPITVTPNGSQSKTYGDSDPALTYTNDALFGGDSISGALGRAAGENAGTYAINLGTLSAGDNYTLSLSAATVNFTINPKTIAESDFTTLATDSKTYTGSALTQTIESSTLALGTDYTVAYETNTYAGTDTAKYTITGTGNYTGNIVKTFSITAAEYDFANVPSSLTVGSTYTADTIKNAVTNAGTVTITGIAVQKSDGTPVTGAEADAIATLDAGIVKAISAGKVVITYSIAAKDVDGAGADEYNAAAGKTVTVTLSAAPSGGGGGGSYTPTYSVTVDKAENGSITVSPKSASKGTAVTVTVKPDEGYELDTLTVTDKDGKAVTVTEKDGKYTFTMPASKVTVKAAFVEIEKPVVNPFVDVKEGDYFYDAVLWAVEKGITDGTSATTFSPDAGCTRAQIVTFLWRAAGSPAPESSSNPFTDVEAGSYYYDAVLWAVEQGITKGTSATAFSPDTVCTRSQTVTLLYRAAGSPRTVGGTPFTDVSDSAYYDSAVQWAVEHGVTAGTGANTFSPDATCTRAQIVTFLYRNAT